MTTRGKPREGGGEAKVPRVSTLAIGRRTERNRRGNVKSREETRGLAD